MRMILMVLVLVPLFSPAWAGRNVNGAIVVHTDNSIGYSANPTPCTVPPSLTPCEALNPNATRVDSQVIWVIAAFRPESSPAVTAIQFGITHTFQRAITAKEACGPGVLEISDSDWPDGTGGAPAGTAIAFSEAVDSHLFPFYWFALDLTGFSNLDGAFFSTTPYPRSGDAEFADDDSPANVDRCYNFGTVRWNGSGENQCASSLGVGACCLPEYRCVETTEVDCAAIGGNYQSDGTACAPEPCAPPTGACCLSDGSCRNLTERECIGYVCAIWGGASTECVGFACEEPLGACCFSHAPCQVLTELACAAAAGAFHCGMTCETDPCSNPPGACCLSGNRCTVLTWSECQAQGGTYRGDYVMCEPFNPCIPPPGDGACCLGGGRCEVTSDAFCNSRGGEWRGEGTSCPAEPPCPFEPPTGACCFVESRCEVLTYNDCAAQGGWWRGGGTLCPPEPPCPWDPPTGACCLDNQGHCEVTTEVDCHAHDGRYWGDGTTCGDAPPCYDTRTRETTWGRIKLGYR